MKLSLSMMIVGILALLAATTGAQEAPVSPAGESQADPAEGPVIEAFPEDEEQSTPEATASEEAPAPPVEEPPPSATPPVETTPPEALQEARERVARATTLFDLNNYDAALVEFQRAYEILGEHPNRYLILYNIAQCHEMRFRYDEALRLYREYLFHGGLEADDRVPVETHIRELEALLATVRVRANAPNAEIFVDGRSIGTAPIAVGIAGGIRTIEVRAPGYISERRQVQLPAGGEEILEFTLEQLSEEFGGIHQAYFWTTVQFRAKEMAEQLRDNGAFIPGLRPGKRTADYLERVMERITYCGAAFLAVIAVLPTFVGAQLGINPMLAQFLGGTGLLICVSVSLDLVQRIEANLVMRNYGGFLGGSARIKGAYG